MKIDVCSDLHGFYPKLEGGDLLIVAGDLTARDELPEYFKFFHWIANAQYIKKIVIGGNHDTLLQKEDWIAKSNADFEYLCDSGTEFEGLKVWGSPWSKRFPGMNPKCMAFTTDTDMELFEKWEMIPDDTDILITHSPSWGFGDEVKREDMDIQGNKKFWTENVGSKTLRKWIGDHSHSLKLHICAHVHEGYGIRKIGDRTISVNASHVNERYEPVNKPIRIEL